MLFPRFCSAHVIASSGFSKQRRNVHTIREKPESGHPGLFRRTVETPVH